MEIYLVRHTTPNIEKGICYGQSDLDLVKDHKSEFKSVIKNIPKSKHLKIFSSPLKRCQLLAEYLGNNITFDERLKELNFGDWELKAWNDIPEKVISPWMKDFVNEIIPNGESYTQLASRVNNCFQNLLVSQNHEVIIIVSHAGPIRALLAKQLGIELKDSFSIKINYGDVFHLRQENNAIELITEINL